MKDNDEAREVDIQQEVRRQFRQIADYIKSEVGEGAELENGLVRAVLSERGCYYEFSEVPEEFSGALGHGFSPRLVGSKEAMRVLTAINDIIIHANGVNTRELSLLACYDRNAVTDPETGNFFRYVTTTEDAAGPSVEGHFRPTEQPLFFKLTVDSDLAQESLGLRKGVIFFVANRSDQHLMVTIPHGSSGARNLADVPTSHQLN
jgi:hypothetical protein